MVHGLRIKNVLQVCASREQRPHKGSYILWPVSLPTPALAPGASPAANKV